MFYIVGIWSFYPVLTLSSARLLSGSAIGSGDKITGNISLIVLFFYEFTGALLFQKERVRYTVLLTRRDSCIYFVS